MSKITLSTVGSLVTNPTTANSTINSNFSTIQTAFDNTLSRDGTSPNQMESNLDMNSFHILNLPEPSSDNDPIRKIDLTNVSTITNLIHTASSTTNTIGTGNLTFTVPSALGFQTGQFVLVQETGNTANYMGGRVVSYSGTTLTLNITATGGNGTFSNWTIDVSGAPGAAGATGPQGPSGTTSAFNVYETRAAAITATIPNSVNMIKTLAYDTSYTPESGATFTRVSAGTPFIDTWPTSITITGGSGYVNGTYYGVIFTGGSGGGNVGTVVVSGSIVTSIDFSTQPGNGYKAGDILTCANTSLGGSGSGFSFTITSVSSPLASFTNTVDGSLWQYLPDKGCTHVNQFGAKPDWINSDSTATNNFNAIQAALFFGGRGFSEVFQGIDVGDCVKCGQGVYMILPSVSTLSLTIPDGVFFVGTYGTTIKISDSWNAATNCINIGNPNAHFANFNCGIKDMQIMMNTSVTNVAVGTSLIYSNNMQDGSAIERVDLLAGYRGGFKYEIGYGGASVVKFHDLRIECVDVNTPAFFSVGTSIIDCQRWSVGAPSSGHNATQNGCVLLGNGGMYSFDGIHFEGYPNGFLIKMPAGGNVAMASFKNVTGGLNLSYVFTLDATNAAGNASFERCQKNNGLATGLVLNGQSGGVSRTADILPKDGIVFFNP